MENLTKRDLVVRISNETNLVQQDVLKVIQLTLDHVKESLLKGNAVQLRNFGVFEIKIRKARVGRNPNKPETDVPIPARAVVKFKAGKEMKAELIRNSAKLAQAVSESGNSSPSAESCRTAPHAERDHDGSAPPGVPGFLSRGARRPSLHFFGLAGSVPTQWVCRIRGAGVGGVGSLHGKIRR